jgi:curved DNA-binding protein
MEYKDYYQVLGVSRDANEKKIKGAFRKLARKCHPDINPGDPDCEERFKEINEAYEVLSDPEKRAKYDQLGVEWQRYQQTGGQPGGFNWGRWTTGAPGEGQRVHVQYGAPEDLEGIFGGGGAFSDFFSSIFGGMQGARPGGAREGYAYRPRPRRGQDYEHEVEITQREAYQGTTRILQKDGRRLEVTIPPGAKTGTRVRMSGEGGQGAASGKSGDLYLRVRVQTDPVFEREGDDLRASVPVDLYTAVLGGEVRVPTLNGPVMLTIPEGTQNGRVFRLRSKGMPRLMDPKQHGDLYARVDVQLPADLTPRQRELFEELQRS